MDPDNCPWDGVTPRPDTDADGDGETNTDDDGEGETTDPNTTVAFESSRPQETLALKANLKKNSTAVRFHSQAQVFLL